MPGSIVKTGRIAKDLSFGTSAAQAIVEADPLAKTEFVQKRAIPRTSEQMYEGQKAPQKWLKIIEPWVLEHQRWPSQNIEEERGMYDGARNAICRHPADLAAMRLVELRDKYGK